jgi:hypothetical protein
MNQLKCSFYLSHDNIIHNILGVKREPISLELKLAFDGTPNPFDSFCLKDELKNKIIK